MNRFVVQRQWATHGFLRSSIHHLTKAVAFLCWCFTYSLRCAVVDETPSVFMLEQACTPVGISSVVFLLSGISIVLSPVFLSPSFFCWSMHVPMSIALSFFSLPLIVHRFDFQAVGLTWPISVALHHGLWVHITVQAVRSCFQWTTYCVQVAKEVWITSRSYDFG